MENVFKIYLAKMCNGKYLADKTGSWKSANRKLGKSAYKIMIRHATEKSLVEMKKDQSLILRMMNGESRIETKENKIVVVM